MTMLIIHPAACADMLGQGDISYLASNASNRAQRLKECSSEYVS